MRRGRDTTDRRRVVVELQLGPAATKIAPVFGPVVRGWRKALSDYDETELALILDFLNRITSTLEVEVERLRSGVDVP